MVAPIHKCERGIGDVAGRSSTAQPIQRVDLPAAHLAVPAAKCAPEDAKRVVKSVPLIVRTG